MRSRKAWLALLAFASVVAAAALLAACSPSATSAGGERPDSGSAVAAALEWSADSDCAMCHEAEGASMADAACEVSQSHGGLTCVSCHTDTSALESVHAEVDAADYKAPKKLSDTEVASEACEACHDAADLAQKTAALELLTDKNGKTVNPHDMPETEQHESITCSSCHDMHSESEPSTDAPAVCASCHHANVYECYTCH